MVHCIYWWYVSSFTRLMIALQSRQQLILKSGTQWEIVLDMDDQTFLWDLRVDKVTFEYLLSKLQDNGLHSNHSHGKLQVPATKAGTLPVVHALTGTVTGNCLTSLMCLNRQRTGSFIRCWWCCLRSVTHSFPGPMAVKGHYLVLPSVGPVALIE